MGHAPRPRRRAPDTIHSGWRRSRRYHAEGNLHVCGPRPHTGRGRPTPGRPGSIHVPVPRGPRRGHTVGGRRLQRPLPQAVIPRGSILLVDIRLRGGITPASAGLGPPAYARPLCRIGGRLERVVPYSAPGTCARHSGTPASVADTLIARRQRLHVYRGIRPSRFLCYRHHGWRQLCSSIPGAPRAADRREDHPRLAQVQDQAPRPGAVTPRRLLPGGLTLPDQARVLAPGHRDEREPRDQAVQHSHGGHRQAAGDGRPVYAQLRRNRHGVANLPRAPPGDGRSGRREPHAGRDGLALFLPQLPARECTHVLQPPTWPAQLHRS